MKRILTLISIIYLTLCTQTVRSDKYTEQYPEKGYPDYYQYDRDQMTDHYDKPGYSHTNLEDDQGDSVDIIDTDTFNGFTMMQIVDLSNISRTNGEVVVKEVLNNAPAEERVYAFPGLRLKPNKKTKRTKDDKVGARISAPGCGETKGYVGRIVNGADAPEGAYPWVVIILKNGEPFCGGSIINTRWILTAAHCFIDGPPEDSTWHIKAGSVNRKRGTRYKIEKVVVHERFNFDRMMNSDIALMKTSKPMKMTELVRPICLPKSSYDDPHVKEVVVVGWGAQEYDDDNNPLILQEVALKLVRKGECAKKYSERDYVVYMSQICTWNENKDACQGDSGGPVIETIKGISYAIGIVSYGGTCADEWPGVYTQVSYFLKWILWKINAKN